MLAVHETMTDLFLTIRQTMFAAASRESRLKTQLEQQGISPASNEPPTGHTPDQPGSLVQRDRSDDGREGGSSNNDNDTSNSNADNAPPPPLPAHSAGSSKPTSMRDFDSLDDGEGATSLPHPKPAADSCRPNTIKVRETPAHQLWETAAARYDDVNPPSGRGSKALAPAAVFAEKLVCWGAFSWS
ncbi:hypothetical protein DIPPA_07014 [Diplonema papillatum]|nr:hypothetical protein DIPPA_07014 [Diplonema papillatum]